MIYFKGGKEVEVCMGLLKASTSLFISKSGSGGGFNRKEGKGAQYLYEGSRESRGGRKY